MKVLQEDIKTEKDNSSKSFKDKLVDIYNKRKVLQKKSSLYLNIEDKIKGACELAAHDGRNCVYIMDLRLNDLMDFTYKYNFIRDNGRELEDMIRDICNELGLDVSEGYITWTNS